MQELENVPAVTGFLEAVKIAQAEKVARREEYSQLKEMLITTLKTKQIEFEINGNLETSLPHVLNLSFPGTHVEAMLVNLDLAGIAVSSGSACTAGTIDPSHVLVAMFGDKSDKLKNSIRFSFGYTNTVEQIAENRGRNS